MAPPTVRAPTIALARTPADLARVAPAWDRLQHHPNADRAFTTALLAARGGDAAPFVLALPDLDAPTTLLVGRLARTRLPIRLGYRTLLQPRIRALELVQGGLCGDVDSAVADALAARLWAELRAGTADVLRVEHLPVDHPFALALRRLGAQPSKPLPDKHWIARLPDDYDTFLASRSSNTRRNLRRFEKGFVEPFAGRFRVRTYDRPADLERIARDLEAISRATYHRGLGAGFVDSTEKRALLAQGLAAGCYRALVLELDDKPIAFWDGRRYGATFYTETTGYLPEFQEQRPGWFLLMHLVHELCCDPAVCAIDFGTGDAQYKQMLCDHSHDELPLGLFAPTRRMQWLMRLQSTVDGSARLLRRVLDHTGLTQRLKNAWRQRLARQTGSAGAASGAEPTPRATATPTSLPDGPLRTPPGS